MASIVGFTGTREGMTGPQIETVKSILQDENPVRAVHGDCIGADAQFHDICVARKVWIDVYPSNIVTQRAYSHGMIDTVHTPRPPLDRNKLIVDECDFLIVAPAQEKEVLRSGTWSTYRYAMKKKKTVYLILPSGQFAKYVLGIRTLVYLWPDT